MKLIQLKLKLLEEKTPKAIQLCPDCELPHVILNDSSSQVVKFSSPNRGRDSFPTYDSTFATDFKIVVIPPPKESISDPQGFLEEALLSIKCCLKDPAVKFILVQLPKCTPSPGLMGQVWSFITGSESTKAMKIENWLECIKHDSMSSFTSLNRDQQQIPILFLMFEPLKWLITQRRSVPNILMTKLGVSEPAAEPRKPHLSELLSKVLSSSSALEVGDSKLFEQCESIVNDHERWEGLDGSKCVEVIASRCNDQNFLWMMELILLISRIMTNNQSRSNHYTPKLYSVPFENLLQSHVFSRDSWSEELISSFVPFAPQSQLIKSIESTLKEYLMDMSMNHYFILFIFWKRLLGNNTRELAVWKEGMTFILTKSKLFSAYPFKAVADLNEALKSLQRDASEQFTEAHYRIVLEIVKTSLEFRNFKDISILVELSQQKPVLEDCLITLQDILKNILYNDIARSTSRFYQDCWNYCKEEQWPNSLQDCFRETVGMRILDLPVQEGIKRWLDSAEFREVQRPNEDDLRCFVLGEKSADLLKLLTILSIFTEKNLLSITSSFDILKLFLNRLLKETSPQELYAQLLIKQSHLLSFVLTVKDYLLIWLKSISQNTRSGLFPNKKDKVEAVKRMLSLEIYSPSPFQKSILESFIDEIFINLQYNSDDEGDVFKLFQPFYMPSNVFFWEIIIDHCFKVLKNPLSKFENVECLLGLIKCKNLKTMTLTRYIEFLRVAQNKLAYALLSHLQEAYSRCFDEGTLRNLAISRIKEFVPLVDNLVFIEDLLKITASCRWSKRSVKLLTQADEVMDYLSQSCIFLTHLKIYAPALIKELDGSFLFSMPRDEMMQETLSTLIVRQDGIKGFVQVIGEELCSFFKYFEMKSSLSIRSTLFAHFMNNPVQLSGADDGDNVLGLVKRLTSVRTIFKRILSLGGPKLTVREVVEISKVLQEANRDPTRELDIISTYFVDEMTTSLPIEWVKKSWKSMAAVLELLRLVKTLKGFICDDPNNSRPNILNQFGFSCATSSSEYLEKIDLIKRFDNEAFTECLDLDQCNNILQQLLELSGVKSINDLLGIVQLFQALPKANKVWEFFICRPEYIDDNAMEYNDVFDEKVEEFLSQLGGEDYKLLDNFKAVSQWIALLMGCRAKSYKELFITLAGSPKIRARLDLNSDVNAFTPLIVAQDHMDFVCDLFQYGLSSLDQVLGQFKAIQNGCVYELFLAKMEVYITYFDPKRLSHITLRDEEVRDFQQRLGFVQQEEKASGLEIGKYVELLEDYRRKLIVMHDLYLLGHPQFVHEVLAIKAGGSSPTFLDDAGSSKSSRFIKNEDMNQLGNILTEWKANLQSIMRSNSVLSLFTSGMAQHIMRAIDKEDVDQLLLYVCHIYGLLCANDTFKGKLSAISYNRLFNKYYDWPSKLNALFSYLGRQSELSKLFQTLPPAGGKEGNGYLYVCLSTPDDILTVLCDIFPQRAPQFFEMLWCKTDMALSTLESFLIRAKCHPGLSFAIMEVEQLSLTLQQRLLRASTDDNAMRNIYIVDCGMSILHSATWLNTIQLDEIREQVDVKRVLQNWSSGRKWTNNLLCLVGPECCGKTFQMRKHIAQAQQSCILVVTESMCMQDIVTQLTGALKAAHQTKELLIAVQLSVSSFRSFEHQEESRLLNRINHFLFKLLLLNFVDDESSDEFLCIPHEQKVRIVVELPHHLGLSHGTSSSSAFPVLLHLGKFVDASTRPYEIDANALHVAKYLAALENGTIDNLYQASVGKDVVFVLDNSGSMSGEPLDACKDSLLNIIFPSKLSAADNAGLIIFNGEINAHVNINQWSSAHRSQMEETLRKSRAAGGTNMWKAVESGIKSLISIQNRNPKWLVVLTDGASQDQSQIVDSILRTAAGSVMKFIFITIGLHDSYKQPIQNTCMRQKGDVIISIDQGSRDAIHQAWTEVGELLTVSQQIEKQGESISDEKSWRLLKKYMKLDEEHHRRWTRLHMTFWIRYMRRRCDILASSETFNKNRSFPKFGSTTMSIMLEEVERALANDHHVEWHDVMHEQMIYRKALTVVDGQPTYDYKWSILASNSDNKNADWLARKALLSSLGMHVPTVEDLRREDRKVLDSYLGHGLGVPLDGARTELSSSGHPFDFEIGSLPIIDGKQFVLTLDFVMKMLIINERIECKMPCIMEGETGVSKTALTRMLFTIKNLSSKPSALCERMRQIIDTNHLNDIDAKKLLVLHELCNHWNIPQENGNIAAAWNDVDALCHAMCSTNAHVVVDAILQELKNDPSLDPLLSLPLDCLRCINYADHPTQVLKWFVDNIGEQRKQERDMSWTFYPVNVHAAMTAAEIRTIVETVVERSKRLTTMGRIVSSKLHDSIKLCIFFDEINTCTCMGVLKEIIADHSFNGVALPDNVVIIASCNPAREKIALHGDRREEQGLEWVSGHYQVHPLPPSLQLMAWSYGSLQPKQEQEFIEKRLAYFLPSSHKSKLVFFARCIFEAQQLTRELATEHVRLVLKTKYPDITEDEVMARASSSVSLRDILRVFRIFSFLLTAPKELLRVLLLGTLEEQQDSERQKLMIAIAVTYYMRLGLDPSNPNNDFRKKFQSRLKASCGRLVDIEAELIPVMERVIEQTNIGPGIARTRGLEENIFMVFICNITKTPLMIVGPPGSSKTLAVTIVCENARGEYSKTELYRAAPSMISFHYQCSRRSTSGQIKEIFERAIERQAKADRDGVDICCFVFMDEAGLPEEERESLKVLHYYLEDHVSVAARVGFVAITNHILDAAKSNRCALLTRSKPGHEELLSIARGCLGSDDERKRMVSTISLIDRGGVSSRRGSILPVDSFGKGHVVSLLDALCDSFEAGMNEVEHPISHVKPPAEFTDFIGLRDFMHFIKSLRSLSECRRSLSSIQQSVISSEMVVEALELTMNGLDKATMQEIIRFFLSCFSCPSSSSSANRVLRNPVDLLLTSVKELRTGSHGRCILIIDTTSNDAILREINKLLQIEDPKLLRLSDFPDDAALQQINIISKVRWSTEKGDTYILSNTEMVNEGLYNLFNQHFRKFEDHSSGEIEVVYHTTIAVGAHSRRCKVSPKSKCLVHLTLQELQTAPAPFLNRFAKFRITMADVLQHRLQSHPLIEELPILFDILKPLYHHAMQFINYVGEQAFCGFAKGQTVESAILKTLNKWWGGMESFLTTVSTYVNDEDLIGALFAEFQTRPNLQKMVDQTMRCKSSLRDLFSDNGDPSLLPANTNNKEEECVVDVRKAIVAHVLLREVLNALLQIAIPEFFLSHFERLPLSLTKSFLREDNFHLDWTSRRKQIIFTRMTKDIVQLASSSPTSAIRSYQCEAFSTFTRESQFVDFIREHYHHHNNQRNLAILFDVTQTLNSQINFARSVIDEVEKHCIIDNISIKDKNIILLLCIPNSDLTLCHRYDSTLHEEWAYRYLDGLHSSKVIPWLQLLCGEMSTQDIPAFLRKMLLEWLPSAVKRVGTVIKLHIPLNSNGQHNLFEVREKYLHSILSLSISVNASSGGGRQLFQDMLLDKYIGMWLQEDGQLLKSEVQHGVYIHATCQKQSSLLESITSGIHHMFCKFVATSLIEHVEVFPPNAEPVEKLEEMERLSFDRLFYDGLLLLPSPPMSALQAPLSHLSLPNNQFLQEVDHQRSTSFLPFFRKIFHKMEMLASQILRDTQNLCDNEEEEDESWSDHVKAVHELLGSGTDTLSKLVLDHCWKLDQAQLGQYLKSYLTLYFVDLSISDQQMQFVESWFTSQLEEIEGGGAVVQIHLIGQWYKTGLVPLVQTIEPLLALSAGLGCQPMDSLVSSLFQLCEAGDALNAVIVDHCYKLMEECLANDYEWLQKWVSVTREMQLVALSSSLSREKQLKVDAIWICSVICSSEFPCDNKEDENKLFCVLKEKLVPYLLQTVQLVSETDKCCCPFSFEQIWDICDQCSRGLEALIALTAYWIERRYAMEELDWILETVLNDSNYVATVPEKMMVLLETIIAGRQQSMTDMLGSTSFDHWIEAMSKQKKLEGMLRVRYPEKYFLPPWFCDEDHSNACAPIATIFFYLTWKWLVFFHSQCDLKTIIHLAESLIEQNQREGNTFSYCRRVAVAAVQVMLIRKLAQHILKNNLPLQDDDDQLKNQISIFEQCTDWKDEFVTVMVNLSAKWVDSVKTWIDLLQQQNQAAGGDTTLLSWLQLSANNSSTDDESLPLLDSHHVVASRRPYWISCANDLTSWAISFIPLDLHFLLQNLRLINLLWVIPDIVELYSWLTETVNRYKINESQAQNSILSKMLTRMDGADDVKYKSLWVRVVVGTDCFIQDFQASFSPLADDMSIWGLVSVRNNANGKKGKGKLMEVLEAMVDSYHSLINSVGVLQNKAELHSLDCLNGISEINKKRLEDLSMKTSSCQSLLTGIATFTNDVQIERRKTELMGRWPTLIATCCNWNNTENPWENEKKRLDKELLAFKSSLKYIPRRFYDVKYCYFEEFSMKPSVSISLESFFSQIFHSLEYNEIVSLSDTLRILCEGHSVGSSSMTMTVRDLLTELYPQTDAEKTLRMHLDISDDEKIAFLLSMHVEEIPKLQNYLRSVLQSEAYIFAGKSIELKRSWSQNVEETLDAIVVTLANLPEMAKHLEAHLAKQEIVIASYPHISLQSVMQKLFLSEQAMFRQLGLLKHLAEGLKEKLPDFRLLCGHYVPLRLKLRQWGKQKAGKHSNRSWRWPFLFIGESSDDGSLSMQREEKMSIQQLRENYFTPWFLLDSQREASVLQNENVEAEIFDGHQHEEDQEQDDSELLVPADLIEEGRYDGMGGGSEVIGGGTTAAANDGLASFFLEMKRKDVLSIMLRDLMRQPMKQCLMSSIRSTIDELVALDESLRGQEEVRKAEDRLREFDAALSAALQKLAQNREMRPISLNELKSSIEELQALGHSGEELDEAMEILSIATELANRGLEMGENTTSLSLYQCLEYYEEASQVGIEIDERLLARKELLETELKEFKKQLQEAIINHPAEVVERIIKSEREWTEDSVLCLPDSPANLANAAKQMVSKLQSSSLSSSNKSDAVKARDNAVNDLERIPLSDWQYSALLLIFACVAAVLVSYLSNDSQGIRNGF
eukprot:scaffold1431_cov167-Ochromonas_danica.AAC.13